MQYASEIISGKFPRDEIKLFQTDVQEGWNDIEIILFHMQPQHNNTGIFKARWVGAPGRYLEGAFDLHV